MSSILHARWAPRSAENKLPWTFEATGLPDLARFEFRGHRSELTLFSGCCSVPMTTLNTCRRCDTRPNVRAKEPIWLSTNSPQLGGVGLRQSVDALTPFFENLFHAADPLEAELAIQSMLDSTEVLVKTLQGWSAAYASVGQDYGSTAQGVIMSVASEFAGRDELWKKFLAQHPPTQPV